MKRARTASAATSPRRTPADALSAFVENAKAALPYQVGWAANQWDVSASDTKKRAHKDNAVSLFFTRHAGSRVPLHRRVEFETAFGDLAKACVVHRRINRGVQSGIQRVFVRAVRYVYEACGLPVRRDPTLLSLHHFLEAEKAALQRERGESAYRVGQMLEDFAAIIDRHGLARAALDFRCSIARPENADKTSTTFEERVARLPAPAVLDALAEISNDPRLLEDDFDVLCMRVVELLFVGGFRSGELLTVPKNALVREVALDESGEVRLDPVTGTAAERIGLRYWPEKGGEPIIKWVPTVANPLVIRAVADIERLCEDARDNAAWLEAHPGDVRADFADDARLSLINIAKIVGVVEKTGKAKQWLQQPKRRQCITMHGDKRGREYVLGADLRRAIASDRYDAPAVVTPDGKRQSLSQSLIVIFMHAASCAKPTNRYISLPLTSQHISDFLCGRGGVASIFARLGYKADDGKPMRIRTHDFRRVLNTIAQKGGLSQVEIAQWMGRRRVADNEAYDYRTPADIAEQLRPLVERNDVFGEVARQAESLPQTERQEFLRSRLTMVHTTPYGRCGSSIAENPCETAVSCLGGCRYYMRRKGDEKSRARLRKIEAETLVNLERARDAAAAGKHNAENWLRAQQTVLDNVRKALAIDDDKAIAAGAITAVNPEGPSIGEPL